MTLKEKTLRVPFVASFILVPKLNNFDVDYGTVLHQDYLRIDTQCISIFPPVSILPF